MNNVTPLHDIRIGTLVPGSPEVDQYIAQILPHGFESFSITFWQTTGDVDLVELAKRVKDNLAESDAVISSIGIYGNPLGDEPADVETVRSWERIIDAIHHFDADVVTGFAGRLRDRPIDESMPRFTEVFSELAKRADDCGVRLAFENCAMGGNWQSGDWNIAHNPRAWEMMFDAVSSDRLGLEWEPCHQMVCLIDPLPQLARWTPRIFHVHGKDATIHWDVVRRDGIAGPEPFAFHRTPGFGDSNWTNILSELRRHGFVGSIDIEGWHDPVYHDELEMTGQVHALNYLKRCRGGEFVTNPDVS
ncbi:MAG: sugar phosphate isomerase/epimerase [Phycisphaerales bacterium]|nr:sugar phosphate isomerase/epimerase [Phycisphaerales bacterium]